MEKINNLGNSFREHFKNNKERYFNISKHVAISFTLLFFVLLLFNYIDFLPETWNLKYFFTTTVILDVLFACLYINKIPEEEREKSKQVYFYGHFFLLGLLIIALNQFLERQIIIDWMFEITVLTIAFGFLTFFAHRNRVEKEIEQEKEDEEKAEEKRKEEFDSKFKWLTFFNFSYGIKESFKEKKGVKGIFRVLISPFVWLARLPYSFVKWMYKEGWWYAIALVLILILTTLPFIFFSSQYIGNDEGSYIYEAKLISEGRIPLKDFISRAPSVIYPYSIVFSIFGYSFIVLKILNGAIFFSIGIMVYLLVKKYQIKKIAILAMVATLINPAFFLPFTITSTGNLTLLYLLIGIHFIKKESQLEHLFSGVFLALSVLGREINLIFVFFILFYLIFKKDYQKLKNIILGGLIVGGLTILFFGIYIGFLNSIGILTGISKVGMSEAKIPFIYSKNIFKLFLIFIFPISFLVLFLNGDFKKNTPYESIWILSIGLFYLIYSFKRVFSLTYGSEFIPLIIILIYSNLNPLYNKKKIFLILIIFSIVLPFVGMQYINYEQGGKFNLQEGYDINRLIGTGIEKDSFLEINDLIRKNTNKGDIVLSGNLIFSSENDLDQFLFLTRVLAYEGKTDISQIYNIATIEEIKNKFVKTPPQLIVLDNHLRISIYPHIKEEIDLYYEQIYSENQVKIFLFK